MGLQREGERERERERERQTDRQRVLALPVINSVYEPWYGWQDRRPQGCHILHKAQIKALYTVVEINVYFLLLTGCVPKFLIYQ